MNWKIFTAVGAIILAIGGLIYAGVSASAKEVVTVSSLLSSDERSSVRLGARVADAPIEYVTSPSFLLTFSVHDIGEAGQTLPVRYEGIMPDTLKPGRDVILEGEYRGNVFTATTLLTQCPSKYEVPLPDGSAAKHPDSIPRT